MIYSVWNQGTSSYDYYEDDVKQASLNAPSPKHIVSRTLGSTVDQASWPLPAGARMIGSGEHAIGRVASRGGAALGVLELPESSLVKAGLLVVSAWLLWKYAVKTPRRRRA